MPHRHARSRAENVRLTPRIVRKTVLSLFRRRNDYGSEDLTEILAQLEPLGVTTAKQLRLIMKRHRRSLRQDEKRRMSNAETRWLAGEMQGLGLDTHANKSWFGIPGLVRQAMELELGDKAAAQWTITDIAD